MMGRDRSSDVHVFWLSTSEPKSGKHIWIFGYLEGLKLTFPHSAVYAGCRPPCRVPWWLLERCSHGTPGWPKDGPEFTLPNFPCGTEGATVLTCSSGGDNCSSQLLLPCKPPQNLVARTTNHCIMLKDSVGQELRRAPGG